MRPVILALCALFIPLTALQAREQSNKKISLSLKATPSVSFAPARVVVVAELKGGPDDSDELYCPTVDWEWGDFTQSITEADCDPFTPGKSEIKRRYTIEHQFKNPGSFKIELRLKKGSRVVAQGAAQIQVRPGLGQGER